MSESCADLRLLFHILLLIVAECGALGEDCDNGQGECLMFAACPSQHKNLANIDSIPFCDRQSSIVCCKKKKPLTPIDKQPTELQRVSEEECAEYQMFAPKTCPLALIVGGRRAEPKEFPHMALLGIRKNNSDEWYCGGTLISRNYVLTAAHCFDKELNHVRLGELDYNSDKDDALVQDFGIKNSILHPSYTFEKYNDIALIELDRPAIFNAYVRPACLAPSTGDEFDEYIAAGWGSTDTARAASSHLLQVKLERFADAECKELVKSYEFDDLSDGVRLPTQLCAGSHTNSSDTCNGDSGGPLFVNHPKHNCMYMIVGITSFGPLRCGQPGNPGVYIRVNLYTSWIELIVWNAKAKL